MKSVLLASLLALVLASEASACSGAAACLPDNMQIEIYGKSMSPKPADYELVRSSIGSLVADLSVKKFVLQATGIEGGFTACLVPNGSNGKTAMMQKLMSIEVDHDITSYEVKFVEQCAESPNR